MTSPNPAPTKWRVEVVQRLADIASLEAGWDSYGWVYDLVMDLQEQERTHPKLMFTSGGFDGYQQWDWCPCNALARVPAEVRTHAAVLAAYLRGVTVRVLPDGRCEVLPPAGDNQDADPSGIAGSKGVHVE